MAIYSENQSQINVHYMGLNWDNKRGHNNNNGRKLVNLSCADNTVLFANSNDELQKTVNELTKLRTDGGLQIKDKIMPNSTETETKLNGEFLDYVPE